MTIDGQCNCFLFEHHLNDFHYNDLQISKQQQLKIQLKPSQHHVKYDKMVFSIDPATSVDLDDALSIEQINNNQYQIGIHISDVSQYLKYIQRTQLIKRTTSVYLPHKCYHMLTPELMKISSLNPNVQRLAFSIFVKMNQQGQILGTSKIQKNVVTSKFKLSYQTVQDIITAKIDYQQFILKHPSTAIQQFHTLVQKLQQLTKIGLAHRQKRIKFQVFQNRQIHFQLDQNKWPIDISVQSRFTSKKIVQEFMIIGNVQAANHLIKSFPQNSLIIYHPMPSQLAIKNFNQTFKFLNKTFTFDDIHSLQSQFLQIQNDKTIDENIKQYMYFKGRRMQQSAGYKLYHQAAKQIIQKMKLQSKNQNKTQNNTQKQFQSSNLAKIQIENIQPIKIKNVHFALGQDFYTHFTSPMRRMADILVHQTLNSLIYKTQAKPISSEQIQKINLGRKHTKRLKKDLTQIYMCLMIYKTNKVIKQTGIITSFGLKSVSIYIPYFDMMKQIMWRDELDIYKVSKNRQNEDMLDVCIYYDRKSSAGDIFWKVKKYDKVELIIDCTKRPPLRLAISLVVISTKGKKQRIEAYFPND